MNGNQLPSILTQLPGPQSQKLIDKLSKTECPAITARRARRADETGVSQDPIVWESAVGANVRDVDQNVFVDLTGAFAVSGPQHRAPEVTQAAHQQLDRLIHAMGDVYPSDVKIEFCDLLAEIAPGNLQQSILGMSGADAVTAALKTAAVHTGKPGVISFWGGYHGLSYGALSVTAYRAEFRRPFVSQLNPHVTFVPYPDTYRPPFGMKPSSSPQDVCDAVLTHIRRTLSEPATGGDAVGAIIVEPIQGRGGEVVPPDGFLAGLRELADEFDVVLIFDEIFTGLGRTGRMFACEYEGVVPDIMCVGKALGGGFPLSAAIGTTRVMGSWGLSSGEAVHTSTFLGNPLGCAMATAVLKSLKHQNWPLEVAEKGERYLRNLRDRLGDHPNVGDLRGRGLMIGLDLVLDRETRAPAGAMALQVMEEMRNLGFLVLPSGSHGNVLGLSPPFCLSDEQWDAGLGALEQCFARIG